MLATLWRGAGMLKFCSVLIVAVGLGLSGCVKTSMQGYADRDLPSRTIQHLAVYVAAPGPLASSMQSSVAEEARKRGVMAEDALTILPPTRTYTDAEIRKALAERGVDGVLLITVADSGVQTQYAVTIFQSSYNGMSSVDGTITRMGNTSTLSANGVSSGTMFGTATPTYRYSRRTEFSARLLEPKSDLMERSLAWATHRPSQQMEYPRGRCSAPPLPRIGTRVELNFPLGCWSLSRRALYGLEMAR